MLTRLYLYFYFVNAYTNAESNIGVCENNSFVAIMNLNKLIKT